MPPRMPVKPKESQIPELHMYLNYWRPGFGLVDFDIGDYQRIMYTPDYRRIVTFPRRVTLGVHVPEGYSTCLVCVCMYMCLHVCVGLLPLYIAPTSPVSTLKWHYAVLRGLFLLFHL